MHGYYSNAAVTKKAQKSLECLQNIKKLLNSVAKESQTESEVCQFKFPHLSKSRTIVNKIQP